MPVEPHEPRKAKPKKAEKPRPATGKPQVVDAEIVEAAVVSPPRMKEVVWSEGTDVPPANRKI